MSRNELPIVQNGNHEEDVGNGNAKETVDEGIGEQERSVDADKSLTYLSKSFEKVTPGAHCEVEECYIKADAAKAEELITCRTDRYNSRARIALGSVIDIRRSIYMGDVIDRKAVRYMNTYKLESDNPFNPEKVDKILRSVMTEAIENLTYDPDKCPNQAKWASLAIRAQVKELEFDRYKIICLVTIGEKNSQDVLATCRFLWDANKDRYSVFSLENTYVFGIAQCFGLYYE